jgi:hypothetical protein
MPHTAEGAAEPIPAGLPLTMNSVTTPHHTPSHTTEGAAEPIPAGLADLLPEGAPSPEVAGTAAEGTDDGASVEGVEGVDAEESGGWFGPRLVKVVDL